jgi:hypothetical protein
MHNTIAHTQSANCLSTVHPRSHFSHFPDTFRDLRNRTWLTVCQYGINPFKISNHSLTHSLTFPYHRQKHLASDTNGWSGTFRWHQSHSRTFSVPPVTFRSYRTFRGHVWSHFYDTPDSLWITLQLFSGDRTTRQPVWPLRWPPVTTFRSLSGSFRDFSKPRLWLPKIIGTTPQSTMSSRTHLRYRRLSRTSHRTPPETTFPLPSDTFQTPTMVTENHRYHTAEHSGSRSRTFPWAYGTPKHHHNTSRLAADHKKFFRKNFFRDFSVTDRSSIAFGRSTPSIVSVLALNRFEQRAHCSYIYTKVMYISKKMEIEFFAKFFFDFI